LSFYFIGLFARHNASLNKEKMVLKKFQLKLYMFWYNQQENKNIYT